MAQICTALVIDEPWITKIARGEKKWEMRSKPTNKRERIGLIKKGSSKIVALATIHEVLGPFDDSQITDTFVHHRVPTERIGKWRYAWVLRDVVQLDKPINYVHKNGAVTFVTLDPTARAEATSANERFA